MAENIVTCLGDKIKEVEMPKDTVIATTDKMIQILNIDAKGMIREWRFEMFKDGLVLYDPLHEGQRDMVWEDKCLTP